MPTVSVGRDRLFKAIGKVFTKEEFETLCFDFGIELDEETTEKAIIRKEKHLEKQEDFEDGDEEIIYKIEIPANRYDLLCLEGIARSLRVFMGKEEIPKYNCVNIPIESMLKVQVKPETNLIRPFVVCAVLRGVTFNQATYNSFIDLQDKLHQNICRKRTLVAIGTHDLDQLKAPFTYEALPPSEINFIPLKQEKSFRANELMEFYKSDMKLKKFLHIIENSPVYPVLYDNNRTVISLPPIINGAHSAIRAPTATSSGTKNVFIECTATDLTKAKTVLNTMVTMFSEYCERKYEVEPVMVIYPDDRIYELESCDKPQSFSHVYPDLSATKFEAPLSAILGGSGISLSTSEVIPLLKKMSLDAKLGENNNLVVSLPPTRSDILHACDIMEDIAIAYGYNNIPESMPQSMTTGWRQPLNWFSDEIRLQVGLAAGYMEVLTWILCSHEENFELLRRQDNGDKAVVVANPRSSDFQEVRTTLMSGLLNALKHNVDHPKPIKIFEVGDVVLLDEKNEVGASNNRRLGALRCNVTSEFEEIAGLADRIMMVAPVKKVYKKQLSNEPSFLPGRQCHIIFEGKKIGIFGIVHPEVLENFRIRDPCSFLEIDIQALL